MKGRYRGTNEKLEKAFYTVAAIVLPIAILLSWFDLLEFDSIFTLLLGVMILTGFLLSNIPCGFKADETGFTMSVFGMRKRYNYDDIESVSETHRVEAIQIKSGTIHCTIVELTVKERGGNTKTYIEKSGINMDRPYAENNLDKLPQLIKLCGYIQEQMGHHYQAEATLHPPVTMTSDVSGIVKYPAEEKQQPRYTAAVQKGSSRVVGYYMGFHKKIANLYQILTVLLLPVYFSMSILDYTFERYITAAVMIAAILLLIRISVNPPCRFTAGEDGFAIQTGKTIRKYEYENIEKLSCKVHSRLMNKSYIVLTIKPKHGKKIEFCESSRFTNWQIVHDPSVEKPELMRLSNIIEQAKAAREIW